MIDAPLRIRTTPLALTVAALALAGGYALVAVSSSQSASAAATQVPLGTAGQFAVLAGAGITNTGPTVVKGDIGTFPTTSITGAAGITITGTNRGGDSVVQGAKPDLVTAYGAAAGALPPTSASADLGGQTLVAGVYKRSAALELTGTVTLDGQNDPNSVFIFQAGSSLTTASNSSVALINGAQACHVFWQVGSSATFGTGTAFKGTVMALTSIFARTGATFQGRLLARNGEVTLDTNTITAPGCVTGSVVTTPTPTASATPTETTPTPTPSPTPSPSATVGSTVVDEGDSDGGGASGGAGTDSSSASGTSSDSTTDLPGTGGPSTLWLLTGTTAVLVGATTVAAARRRTKGAHRG